MLIFSSMTVGGGGVGTVAGTARGAIVQAGYIISMNLFSIEMFLENGGAGTGIVAGADILGSIGRSPSARLRRIGGIGSTGDTGKEKTPGGYEDCGHRRKSELT